MLDGFRLSPDKDDASQHQNAKTHQHRASDPFELSKDVSPVMVERDISMRTATGLSAKVSWYA